MGLQTFKPTIWSTKLLENLANQHVYATCCNRDYEGEIKNQGDTVIVNAIGDITIGDYDDIAGLGPPENVYGAGSSLVIDHYKSYHFMITDIDKAQANVSVMNGFMERASWGLADVIDVFLSRDLMAPAVPLANKLNGGTPYTIGPGATDTDFYQLLVDLDTRLSEANVPSGDRWVVMPPSAYGVLRKDDRFVNFGTDANRTVARGEDMGQVANLMVKKSNNVPVTGTAPNQVWTILAGHKMGVSFAEQILKNEGYRPERFFSDAMKGLHVWGGKVFLPHTLAATYVTVAPTV